MKNRNTTAAPAYVEEGTFFAAPEEVECTYGFDRSYRVWDKNADGLALIIRSREEARALIAVAQRVCDQLPPDDETDFALNCMTAEAREATWGKPCEVCKRKSAHPCAIHHPAEYVKATGRTVF